MTDAVPIGSNLLVDPLTMEIVAGNRLAAKAGGGGGAVGAAGVVQASNGSGAFQVSDYFDNLTVADSVTVSLEDSTSPLVYPFPGVVIRGADTGNGGALLIMEPETSGVSNIIQFGYGAYPTWAMVRGNGSRQALTAILNGDDLGEFIWQGFSDNANVVEGAVLNVIAASDFSGTPTTIINMTNASNFGWHIAADGTFSLDKGMSIPQDINITDPDKAFTIDGTPLIGATDAAGAQVGTLTNAPTAGNPAVFLRLRAPDGTIYAVPGWAIP